MNIELRNIHKRFGPVHANNNISVTFKEGRIIGILGENGAGKSTLMKILSGYQPADSGEIWIDNQQASYDGPQTAINYGVGMLQQDPLDVGAFTVIENFIYGRPGKFLLDRRSARQELSALVKRFGFDLDPETSTALLSIAQRQQLEILRLITQGVRTLILDEPTTGISQEQKDILFDTLRELAERDGMIVLLVSHKLEDVIALCHEVIVLRNGRLVGARDMPATTAELVRLMFGQELGRQQRESVEIGDTVLALDRVYLRDKRLDMPDISIELRAGEVVGLAGLDGSGQHLVMRAMAGLERTHGGRVLVRSQNCTAFGYRQFMQRGVIFGAAGRLEEGLIAGLSLTEHMALVMNQKQHIDWKAAAVLMQHRIKQYNVRGQQNDFVEQLSGGNQQRVLMALLPEHPTALLLEQPTRGLDVESARWIWSQLLERRKNGCAIIFSSPELDELVTYSDRIFVFYAGQIHEIIDVNRIDIEELGHLIGGDFARPLTS